MTYFALIPAAGSGARMGAACPKQYLPLAGQPMIRHALQTLCKHPLIAHVYVVLAPDDEWWGKYDWSALAGRLTVLPCGGATRAESVKNGLAAMPSASDAWVLVHDAARPCLQAAHIDALLDGVAEQDAGGILAVPVADTLKLSEDGSIARTVSRADLWQAQTPQMFRHALLSQALDNHAGVTDEASAVEALGMQPKLVMSDTSNLKVTYPRDLQLAEWILNGTRT